MRAFPEYRLQDYEINLKEGQQLPAQKLRRYSYDTTRMLEKYIEVALKKRQIRLSKSLVALNILIAKKKDDLKG